MKGILVIISAPSGAGKSTIIRQILGNDPNCRFAISHTTRQPRAGEKDGVDYYFVGRDEFQSMVANDRFAEWAVVHSNFYGTSLAEVERLSSQGIDVVFEVDYQGGRALMRRFPDAASIFVLPPSMAEVKRRLTDRGTDDAETIEMRLQNARIEIATAGEYRYIVVNDDLDRAVSQVGDVIRVERLRSINRAAMIRDLVAEKV
ncbi:MAG TPA: guanylate kinase [Myxococcota bacterium]|nr:guanylate kinase [Myxococcota bacterium]HOA13560.1 guanylate kinase [Myxococcota bacterium]HOC99386.1 guanylate kinase [Myxococcota bacterium]HOH76740.1 guanylate kinase [Myxococcota bacterium]HPV03822.1 guanylate kinase [Myxococcota bacterium]